MAVQLAGLRQQVDPHWRRGISYLKIGLRWLQGVMHKGRTLLPCVPLLPKDPQPCFASLKAKRDYDDQIWFCQIRSLVCKPCPISNSERFVRQSGFSSAIVAVIVILILLVSCVRVIALAHQYLPFDKQVELLATALANLFGTVVGATLAFWFALRQLTIQSREAHKKALVDTTFELHREFNNSEMSEARNRADKIFKQYPAPVTLGCVIN